MLKSGSNAMGIVLGNGWYRAFRPNNKDIEGFGQESLDAMAQLEVTYTDGTKEIITTDKSWKSSTGPIVNPVFMMGRPMMHGWKNQAGPSPGFDDASWTGVETVNNDKNMVSIPHLPP